LTKASATFFLADSIALWNVGCEMRMLSAAAVCSSPSRSFNLKASNSSTVKLTFCKNASGTPRGLKYCTPGSQCTLRQILGLGMSYEYIFKTNKPCLFGLKVIGLLLRDKSYLHEVFIIFFHAFSL
jgi:hypothetical protein